MITSKFELSKAMMTQKVSLSHLCRVTGIGKPVMLALLKGKKPIEGAIRHALEDALEGKHGEGSGPVRPRAEDTGDPAG